MSGIDDFLERCRAARKPAPPGDAEPGLCLVLCDDAVITGRLDACASEANTALIRLPAASGALSEDVLQRAVAKAVVLEGCREVLLVSHSACTLGAASADGLIEAMKRQGVARATVPYDLREWVGASRDPRQAVRQSAELLRRCPFLPPGIRVDVAHFEDATGELELVDRGETSGTVGGNGAATLGGYEPGPVRFGEREESSPPPPPPAAPTAPPPPPGPQARLAVGAPSAGEVPPALALAVSGIRDFAQSQMLAMDRVELRRALEGAILRKDSPQKQAELVLKHLLMVRGSRESISDELLLLRKSIPKLAPKAAAAMLHGILSDRTRSP